MATRTITALFDSYEAAASAVRKLEAAGIAHGDISIVSNDETHRQYQGEADADHVSAGGTGASLGTLIGGGAGLLAGLGMLAIPGLGPVVAAGWLVSTLLGAGVGAAAGGIVGSLTSAGVDPADADAYAEGIRRGGTLVTVRAEDAMTERVAGILDADGTVDLNQRQASWRNEGWGGDIAQGSTSGAPLGGGAPLAGVPPLTGGAPIAGGAALGGGAPLGGGASLGGGTTTAVPGSTTTGEPGGLSSTVGRSSERLNEDVPPSEPTIAVAKAVPGMAEPTVPVTDYGSTPRPGEMDQRLERDRVRIYPGEN